MSSNPLVSIILPTYNGSRYLDQAIQCCVSQTYENWELIIVDDASTDDTPLIIDRWVKKDSRIRCIKNPTNRKLPASLNIGFAQAKGELLTWTSDDNEHLPQAIEEMVFFLQFHPEVDLVYTDFVEIDEAGAPLQLVEVRSPQELVVEGNVIRCSFLYKRAIQEKLGGYAEDLFLTEDYDFWIRAAASFRLEPLHKAIYRYRLHSGSLTTSKYQGVQVAIARTILRHLPLMSWLTQEQKALVCFDFGMHLFELRLIDEAQQLLKRAFLPYEIHKSLPEHALQTLLYQAHQLRKVQDIQELFHFIPDQDSSIKAFKKDGWGQYHGARCFEGFREQERSIARYHMPKAVWYRPKWLGNRGFIRIVMWAYIGYN